LSDHTDTVSSTTNVLLVHTDYKNIGTTHSA